jgi:NADH-quinone oxidoreductase subunit G
MCAKQMDQLSLVEGEQVLVRQDQGSAVLSVKLDNHVAMGCVRVAAAHEASVGLGDLMGDISIEKLPSTKGVSA